MEQIHTKVRRWGNSFGIVLPMRVVEKENLKEGAEITITIKPKEITKVKDVFGILKKELKDIDTQKALREVDKAFWPEE